MKASTALVNSVMLAVSAAGALVFRNNVGLGWSGRHVSTDKKTGMTVLQDARPVRFGLITGSGDLIGGTPVKVTPDMVGKTLLVFSSLEVKSGTGRPTQDQKNFRDQIIANGGIAVVVHSVDEALSSLKIRT